MFSDNTQNYLFCRLKLVVETFKTQLNEPTNLIKAPMLSSQRYHKIFGNSVINSQLSSLSLWVKRLYFKKNIQNTEKIREMFVMKIIVAKIVL